MSGSRLDGAFSSTDVRDLFAAPGTDTRQWISIGWVQSDSEDGHSVAFQDENGTPLPNGVRVMVKLEPSGYIVPCMVGSHVSGVGESEYHPMGPGDIVLVAIPQGDERAGCVIICRISLSQDTFPQTVAGMDITQNNVNFKRMSLPYVLETAGSYLIRHALTGASWSIDPSGNIIFTDGEGNSLSLTQSVISLGEVTNTALLQIDPAKLTVALQSGATSLVLDDTGQSTGTPGVTLMTGGSFNLLTSGGGYAAGHAVTLEQVLNLIQVLMFAIASNATSPPALISWLANWLTPAALGVLVQSAAEGVSMPPLPASPTPLPLSPAITAAIAAGLAGQVPDPTGSLPGIGRTGFLY